MWEKRDSSTYKILQYSIRIHTDTRVGIMDEYDIVRENV